MPTSHERIRLFMQLYEDAFKEKITEEEAGVMIAECVQFYQDLLTPLGVDLPDDQETQSS